MDRTAIAGRFLEWYRSRPADVGNQTRWILSHAADAGDVVKRAAEYFDAHPESSAGNGSLMRTAPVALAGLGDDSAIVELATSVSALTHADPRAGEASLLWCVAIDRAIRRLSLEGVREGVELLPPGRRAYWNDRIEEVEVGPASRFSPNGFVVAAFQAALAAIWHTPVPSVEPCRHLQQALHAAVRIGDDADTVAAIAGALLGARWGASAIPVEWRAILHGKPGVYGQPDYTARDLVRLAVLSAWRGEPDDVGWPKIGSLVPYYESDFPAPPLVRQLDEDPGLLMANIFGAAEASADVTISLCRMGRIQLDAAKHPLRIELGLLDGDDSANPNLDFTFRDLASSIVRWRDAGKTVLVHCVQAEHRTPAVAAAYLAERSGLGGREALQKVCAELPKGGANRAFAESLDRVWPAG